MGMTGDWVIDELAHAGPEHRDPAFVSGYDRKQGWPDFSPDVGVLREHGVDSGSTVVDLGAGTGRFALAAAPHVRRVVAVEVSPAMLSALRVSVAAASRTNIEVVQAGFLSYEHTGSPADAVFTRNALHQLPDFWKAMALDRIAALLRPGGVLRLHDLIFDFRAGSARVGRSRAGPGHSMGRMGVSGAARSYRAVRASQVSAPVISAGVAGCAPSTSTEPALTVPAATIRSASLPGRPRRTRDQNRPNASRGPIQRRT